MVTCQQTHAVKEATRSVSEQQSLQLTRNLMRIAIFNISYIRGLFPAEYFVDKFVPALEMKIKKLLPLDHESRRLIDWMEKGVYDALHHKYLKTLLFIVCDAEESHLIEEYSCEPVVKWTGALFPSTVIVFTPDSRKLAVCFSYSQGSAQDASVNIIRNGDRRRIKTITISTPDECSPTQMKNAGCKMVRTLVQLMHTLDHVPLERTILMKLFYYDDVTPPGYEPPFFRACSGDEKLAWSRMPVKLKVGEVDSKHFAISLQVKSILDPCEGENEKTDDQGPGLGSQRSESSGSGSHHQSDLKDQQLGPDNGEGDTGPCVMEGDDPTEDPAVATQIICQADAPRLEQIKDWAFSREMADFNNADVLQKIPDISAVGIEDILGSLVQENVLSVTGKNRYQANDGEREALKGDSSTIIEPVDRRTQLPCGQETPVPAGTFVRDEEATILYLMALSHVLPMDYITTAQLHAKLGRPTFGIIRKLMDKMAAEGYIEEVSSNRRLGRRVLHTKESEAKLLQVKQSLNMQTQILQAFEGCTITKPLLQAAPTADQRGREREASKFARNSIVGSDVTGQCLANPNSIVMPSSGLKRPSSSDAYLVQQQALSGVSPQEMHRQLLSKAECDLISSQAAFALGGGSGVRKISKVKEPIFQQPKRLRSEP